MLRCSLSVLFLLAISGAALAQSVPHPAAAKKTVHKKTVITKTVVIDEDEGDESDGFYEDEMEEGMQPNGDYVVIVDEVDEDNGYAENEPAGDDSEEAGTTISKTIHRSTTGHNTGHIYSSKYPKKLYYYNPKTGYYYKRRVPLKS